jgi:hypothetical protein
MAAEQHGHRTKKTLAIQAETIGLTLRLARESAGISGPMGIKSITKHLKAGIRTRDGRLSCGFASRLGHS